MLAFYERKSKFRRPPITCLCRWKLVLNFPEEFEIFLRRNSLRLQKTTPSEAAILNFSLFSKMGIAGNRGIRLPALENNFNLRQERGLLVKNLLNLLDQSNPSSILFTLTGTAHPRETTDLHPIHPSARTNP